MRLTFADALNLWRVQGIDLAATLVALLLQHAPGEIQRPHGIDLPEALRLQLAQEIVRREK